MISVLVVDPNPDSRFIYTKFLEHPPSQIKCVAVASAEDVAKALIIHDLFDVLITENILPHLDALKILKKVKGQNPGTLCIIFSVQEFTPAERQNFFENGFEDILSKLDTEINLKKVIHSYF